MQLLIIITEKDLCSVQTLADCLNPGPPSLPPIHHLTARTTLLTLSGRSRTSLQAVGGE